MAIGLGIFGTLVQNLNALGFYGFVLPWLLIFAVVYGLLIGVKAFGDNKKVSGVVALVFAFFITAYTGIGSFFVNLFGFASIFLAIALVVILFIAFAGFELKANIETFIIVAIIALIIFFVLGGGIISGIALTDESIAVLFIIIFMALVVLFLTKGEEKVK